MTTNLQGKTVNFPKLDELQRSLESVHDWIDYSTFDAECTWHVRVKLEELLRQMKWVDNLSMWDFYIVRSKCNFIHGNQREWIPFGDLLTELEKNGIKVDVEYLKKIEQTAIKDYDTKRNLFINWASKYCPDAKYMNIESDPQVFLETS